MQCLQQVSAQCVDISLFGSCVRQNGEMTNTPDQARSGYLRWGHIGLVFLGGTLGVLAREGLALAMPNVGGFPASVLLANVVGALLLGLLLESMGSFERMDARRQSLRLLLGTGLLGGFTTYSALAQAVLVLWSGGAAWVAVGYGAATLLLGGGAAWGGVLLGAAIADRRVRRNSQERGDGG